MNDSLNERRNNIEAAIKKAMSNKANFKDKSLVYGFSMYTNENGNVVFSEFGDILENGKRIPITEIKNYSNDEVTVYVELPGVAKEDVNFVLMDNGRTSTLMIDAGKFYKEFDLNTKVKEKDIKAEFNNGVLKITLTKSEPEKPKNVKINIL
ncbi:MAG: Hsp20/alpha crystallin family protein [Bacteroidales bacterium]|nr:Hsp20/alpha crystallin family protein [Bacteroidales bacterium]